MDRLDLLPIPPAPDAEWMRQFAGHLCDRRPDLPNFSARQLALQAYLDMYLLTPFEAAGLWDERMWATNAAWRRLAAAKGRPEPP